MGGPGRNRSVGRQSKLLIAHYQGRPAAQNDRYGSIRLEHLAEIDELGELLQIAVQLRIQTGIRSLPRARSLPDGEIELLDLRGELIDLLDRARDLPLQILVIVCQ